MGKIISQAGEVAFNVKSLKREGDDLVIIGIMGIWEARVYLSYKEILALFLNRNLLLTIIVLPIQLLKGLFRQSEK